MFKIIKELLILPVGIIVSCALSIPGRASVSPHGQPLTWVDPQTGHRIIQLSREPDSENLYFNLNPFTPDGKKMVMTTPTGIDVVDLKTYEVDKIVKGNVYIIMVGLKTGRIYYATSDRCVFSIDPITKKKQKIVTLPPNEQVSTVNADETLLAGLTVEAPGSRTKADFYDLGPNQRLTAKDARIYRYQKPQKMTEYSARHYRMGLFSYNIKTGETKKFYSYNGWLNHLQFSPTDPNLLLFCHEGHWYKEDRIWMIRSDGTGLKLIHQKSMPMEIAGHEFWGADGKTIWYDLHILGKPYFSLVSYDISTGFRMGYQLQSDEESVHYNVSADGRFFSGDGKDVIKGGKWIYLFYPTTSSNQLYSERLVNMANNDYSTEPNAVFTPDMKWIIFRGNMSGVDQVYAVEIKGAAVRSAHRDY